MTELTDAARTREQPVEGSPPDRSQEPLTPPWATTGLLEVFRRHYLLTLLVRREISARYQGSVLGLLWSYVNPLTQFAIYYFVMGVLFNLHKDVQNFAVHMFCGIMIVHFFTETFMAGTRSIVRNKSLVQKMAMPREMFPVATMLVSAYHMVPQIVILLVICLGLGWTPDPTGVLALVMSVVVIMVLGTAMALLFSAANVFFRDVSNVASILSNFVRFGVPMIYPYTLVSERFHGHTELYLANPIADAVLLMQRAFWVGTTDNAQLTISQNMPTHLIAHGVIAMVSSLAVLAVGQLVFSRLQDKIPERI